MAKHYYEILRELRTDRDMTQEQVAEILQTRQEYYSKYETGKRELPLHHLKTLCMLYQVSADYILGLPQDLKWPREGTRIINIHQRDNGTNNISF